jgi:predicted amidophosphoribosyltransferase
VVAIHPIEIEGRWRAGVALDYHTTSSTPVGYNEAGYMQFHTVRPEIAELLYQLKYKGNRDAARGISAAVDFLRPHRAKFDVLVPVPPSAERTLQPVIFLAEGIGAALGLPVANCVTTTRPAFQLKSVVDPERRQELVAGLYAVERTRIAGKNVLLFDDLFRSGATMNAITDVLLQHGQAGSVRALTITKTRSNQ